MIKRNVAAVQGRSPYLPLFLIVTIVLGSLFTAWLIVEPGKLNVTLVGAGMGALLVAASPFYVVLAEILLIPLDWLPAWGPLYAIGLLAFVSMGLAIGIKAARKQRFVSPLQWVMLAFVFVATLSALASQPRHTALRTVMPLFQAFALAYSFEAFINTRARLRLVVLMIIGLSTLEAILCIFQPFLGAVAYPQRLHPAAAWVPGGYYLGGFSRAFGTFTHPGNAAAIIAIGLFLLLGLILWNRSRRNWWQFSLVAVLSMGLLATFARAQLFFTIAAIPWLAWQHSRNSSRKAVYVYLLIGLFLLLGILLLPDTLQTTVGKRITTTFRTGSESYRANVNQQSWLVFLAHPLIGVGYGNIGGHLGEYALQAGAANPGGEPHNLYLALAADTGILGLVLFLFLIWYSDLSFGRAVKAVSGLNSELPGLILGLRLYLWLYVATWFIGQGLGYPTAFLPFAWSAVCLQVAERSRILAEADEAARRSAPGASQVEPGLTPAS